VTGVREWAEAMRAELDAIPSRRGRLVWTLGALVALVRVAMPELGALFVLLCLLAAAPIGEDLVYPVARNGDLTWVPFVALNVAVAAAGAWAALARRPLPALLFLALVAATFGLAVTKAPPVGPFFDAHAAAVGAADDEQWADHSWELRVETGAFAVLVAAVYAWIIVARRPARARPRRRAGRPGTRPRSGS
jgi:hypothetical protein